jgi:hypothetical protein
MRCTVWPKGTTCRRNTWRRDCEISVGSTANLPGADFDGVADGVLPI